MGCYINPNGRSKEEWLSVFAMPVDGPDVEIEKTEVLICWLDNGAFTAAGVAFDKKEKEDFVNGYDGRKYQWFKAPIEEVRKVSPYDIYTRS